VYAGVDFGTSSCSIGVWESEGPVLLPLEGESNRLPSALYTSRSNVRIEEIDEFELKRRVTDAKRRQTIRSKKAKGEGRYIKELADAELENIERGIMRREIAERAKARYEGQSISESLYADTEVVFGEAAIFRHIHDPQSGYFIKSPKSFLGSDIRYDHIELFSEVITRMLAFIKVVQKRIPKQKFRILFLGAR
jgi:hypothetical chaperone protein